MPSYQPRVVDDAINRALRSVGGVLLEGARAVGKTTTGLFHAASSVRLDSDPNLMQLATLEPAAVLAGAVPRLIDEWQLAPPIWNAVRHEIDRRGTPGQFLLAGSSSPADDVTRHSGAGRIIRVRMRTLSLWESGESSGLVSLAALLEGADMAAGLADLTVSDYARVIARGGWPLLVRNPNADISQVLSSYVRDVARTDLKGSGVERDPIRVEALLRALARNVTTEASLASLGREAGGDTPLDQKTVTNYVSDLQRIFVLEEQPAWAAHLRSKVRQRVAPKWHFVDPSLAAVLLGANANRLVADLRSLGLHFESLVIRDLRVYAAANGASVFHYRDETGLEIDAIIETLDGRWLACEVKLGGEEAVNVAARNLQALRGKVKDEQRSRLAGLVVVTAGKVALTRPDGVHVVPLGCLKP